MSMSSGGERASEAAPIGAVLIEGDGIGREITSAALDVLAATGAVFEWHKHVAGLRAHALCGHTAPREMLQAIRDHGRALKGPFSTPSGGSIRSGNYYIRRELDLYACVRRIENPDDEIDILLVRENTEELYGSVEWEAVPGVLHAVRVISDVGCERIARFAFESAVAAGRRRVTIVHKANNLKLTEGRFLTICRHVGGEFPGIETDDLIADAAAAQLVTDPQSLDVIVTTNTFGDLLANVGAARASSLGTVASGNYGVGRIVAEPGHGSAPELEGTGRANPIAMIGAGALLLRASGRDREADAIEEAVASVRVRRAVTPDLGGSSTTAEVAAEVAAAVRSELQVSRG
jgi:isocitrate dehydrogenase (NAD+)